MRSDESLLEAALGGDEDSFGELTRRWRGRIYSFICRYLGDSEEARDLTQDTFFKAYQNLDRLSDLNRFSSWVYKIALNECRMKLRRGQKVRLVSFESHSESGWTTVDSRTPEDTAASREMTGVLKEAFHRLPEEQRSVILMKEYQGLKFHEIAEILDLPLSTVKSRMYLGLKTLRRLMESRL